MTKFVVTYTCTCTLYVCAIAEQVFTVEEAIEKMGFGFFQVMVTVFSGLLWVSLLIQCSYMFTCIMYMYMYTVLYVFPITCMVIYS